MRHAKKKAGLWGALWGNRSGYERAVIAVAAVAILALLGAAALWFLKDGFFLSKKGLVVLGGLALLISVLAGMSLPLAVSFRKRVLSGFLSVLTGILVFALILCASVHLITGRPIWVWVDTLFYATGNLEIDKDFQDHSPEDLGVPDDIHFPEGITNIALFGIDSRSDNMKGLSDSMMIISIDGNNNNIKLVSLQRDSLVQIDGYGWQKLTHAYSFGGAALAVKTINKVYKMNITDYATVDFVGMAAIIDAVGGIDTVMTDAEVKNANTQINEMHLRRGTPLDYIMNSGKVHLNGIQAVGYSRVRKADVHKEIYGDEKYHSGDYGRTLRQRYVMSQLFSKALDLEIGEYPELIQSMIPLMQTSLSYGEIYDLAMILLKDGIVMEQERLPADQAIIKKGASIVGLGSCEYYDLDFAAELLHAFLFENVTFDDYIAVNGVKKNGKVPSSMFASNNTSSSKTDGEDEEDEVTDTGTVTDEEEEDWGDKTSGGKGTGNKGTGSSGGGGDEVTDTPEKPDTSSGSGGGGDSSDESDESDASDSSDKEESSDSSDKPSSESKPSSDEKTSDKEETSDGSDSSDKDE